jgi:zinc protease
MKKILKSLMAFAIGLTCVLPQSASAQQMPPIPVDTAVVIGKLPNGLTYYIRHNEYPKGQADFYIAQKVGSILEEDNQRGLAHFLEHMCFNGTKNFPGNQLISWLESVGVKFGRNLNAYTAVDRTVYNISNVPVARESVQDSCLLILHDWANDLLLDPEEIDKERGVIHEEWRSRMVGQMRVLEQVLPKMYPNNRYGYRLPIGIMDVVDNFEPQALRDYYEKWYRPDQQGIIVVGDIDPVRIENKIKEMFSSIEMPENAAERVYFPVEDTPGTIYAIGHDKEQSNAVASLMFKFEAFPNESKGEMGYMIYSYMTDMLSAMLDARFSDMMSDPQTPFAYAGASVGDFMLSATKSCLDINVAGKGNDIRPAIESVYRELLRAQRGGFTATEYDRARSEYLSRLEKAYNNRNTQETEHFSSEIVEHFLENEPMPGIEWYYPQMKQFSQFISVNEINAMIKQLVTDDNRVLLAILPDKDDYYYPTEDEVATVLKNVDAEDIEAFVDNVKTEPLIASLPKPGSVVSTATDAKWDATVWTLSNGVKVIVKQTPFKNDEIIMRAVAPQGKASFQKGVEPASIKILPQALNGYGIGSYTNTDLDKYLSGKQAMVQLSLGMYSRTVSGMTTPKDLPTMMEVAYGMFTNINWADDEFKAMQELYVGLLQNQEANPQYVFTRDVQKSLYQSQYLQALTVDDVQKANRKTVQSVAKKMLANAADYTFVFVGNVDLDALKPLVEQYIATLPAKTSKRAADVTVADKAVLMKDGSGTDVYTMKMETPQTWAAIIESATIPYSMQDEQLASVASQIMTARLLESVREKEGATYSISAYGDLSYVSGMNASMQIAFPMKPEMKDKVLDIIKTEFTNMESNITIEELNKVKEYMTKSYVANKEKNNAWLSAIQTYTLSGVDTFNGDVDSLNSITIDDVQGYMKRLNNSGNYRIVLLEPEN